MSFVGRVDHLYLLCDIGRKYSAHLIPLADSCLHQVYQGGSLLDPNTPHSCKKKTVTSCILRKPGTCALHFVRRDALPLTVRPSAAGTRDSPSPSSHTLLTHLLRIFDCPRSFTARSRRIPTAKPQIVVIAPQGVSEVFCCTDSSLSHELLIISCTGSWGATGPGMSLKSRRARGL